MSKRKVLSLLMALCMILGSVGKAPAAYASELDETTAAVETIAAEIHEDITSKDGNETEAAQTQDSTDEEAAEAEPAEEAVSLTWTAGEIDALEAEPAEAAEDAEEAVEEKTEE